MLNFSLLVVTNKHRERTDLSEFQYQVDKSSNKMKCLMRSDETETENALIVRIHSVIVYCWDRAFNLL